MTFICKGYEVDGTIVKSHPMDRINVYTYKYFKHCVILCQNMGQTFYIIRYRKRKFTYSNNSYTDKYCWCYSYNN